MSKKSIFWLSKFEHINGNFFYSNQNPLIYSMLCIHAASHTKNIHVWHIFCMTIAFPIPPIDNIQSLYHCLIYKYIQYYSNSCKHINAFLIKVFVIISRNLGKSVIYFFLWLFTKKNYQKGKSKFLIKQKESNWGSK